jgi:uncharacterized Zn finger protein
MLKLVNIAVDYCERGEGRNAITILEAITATCLDKCDEVAEYGPENDEIVQELNYPWTQAILSTELNPEEKVDIQVNLETSQDELNADFPMSLEALYKVDIQVNLETSQDELNADFPMSLEALYHDWDESRLIQFMMGNMTPRGVWTEEVPEFADDLALIRLKILERQERH